MNRLIFRGLVTLSLLGFSLLSAQQVRADMIDYTFVQNLTTPTGVVTNTFTWTLSTPVPAVSGGAVTFNGVSITENKVLLPTTWTVDFFTGALMGGFDIMVGGNFLSDNAGGPLPNGPFTQFFSVSPGGTTTLNTGTFSVTEFGLNTDPGTGTLTATSTSTAVPEPSTLLLSAVGLMIGLALTVLHKN